MKLCFGVSDLGAVNQYRKRRSAEESPALSPIRHRTAILQHFAATGLTSEDDTLSSSAQVRWLIPHYWPLKVFWLFDDGATGAALVHALIGLAWQSVLLMLLVRHFSHIARR